MAATVPEKKKLLAVVYILCIMCECLLRDGVHMNRGLLAQTSTQVLKVS